MSCHGLIAGENRLDVERDYVLMEHLPHYLTFTSIFSFVHSLFLVVLIVWICFFEIFLSLH